jgi:hypothetical protein
MCASTIIHEAQFSTNGQWHVHQEIGLVFEESFVILPCKDVWKYIGSQQIITINTSPQVDGQPLC